MKIEWANCKAKISRCVPFIDIFQFSPDYVIGMMTLRGSFMVLALLGGWIVLFRNWHRIGSLILYKPFCLWYYSVMMVPKSHTAMYEEKSFQARTCFNYILNALQNC